MIKKIMQLIFMDKKGRAAAKSLRDCRDLAVEAESADEPVAEEPAAAERVAEEPAETDAAPADTPPSDRDILLEQAMDLYRKRRAEYEQLDEGVRAKLDKLASDQLGQKES